MVGGTVALARFRGRVCGFVGGGRSKPQLRPQAPTRTSLSPILPHLFPPSIHTCARAQTSPMRQCRAPVMTLTTLSERACAYHGGCRLLGWGGRLGGCVKCMEAIGSGGCMNLGECGKEVCSLKGEPPTFGRSVSVGGKRRDETPQQESRQPSGSAGHATVSNKNQSNTHCD